MYSLAEPHRMLYAGLVSHALLEDIEHGDLTTQFVAGSGMAKAVITAKEPCVCAGIFVAAETFRQVDDGLKPVPLFNEGGLCKAGTAILELKGRCDSILQGERVALNFMQRMCGIATLVSHYVQRLEGTGCRLCDTRKTTPGLRVLEKYAVRAGGGFNHRFSLSDGILIKDNHIAACKGGIAEAINRARREIPHGLKVEVEVQDMDMLADALDAGADILLLDNMDVEMINDAVHFARQIRPDVLLEASGNIHLENVRDYALAGVDVISVGAITHSFMSADLSLNLTLI